MKTVFLIAMLIFSAFCWAREDSCPLLEPVGKAITAHQPIYSDVTTSASVIDQQRWDAMRAIVGPLHTKAANLQNAAVDAYLSNNADAAACVIGNLQHWAEVGSLTEIDYGQDKLMTFNSASERRWVTISVGLSYTYVRQWATVQQREVIEEWITTIGEKILNDVSINGTLYFKPGTENNHEYWNGASLIVVAAATGNEKFLKRARRSYKEAMSAIDDDGFLPKELTNLLESKFTFAHIGIQAG
jgi:hypothetical protein